MERHAPAVQSDAPPPPSDGLPEETGADNAALGWLAVYLPAYGTSTLLHVAAAMVAWFLSMQVMTPAVGQDPPHGNIGVVVTHTVAVAPPRRPPGNLQKPLKVPTSSQTPSDKPGDGGHGLSNYPGNSITREFRANPFPDEGVALLGRQLDVIGVGTDGDHIGGMPGMPGGGRAGFFGTGGNEDEGAHKIVYIVDRSGSMTDSIDFVKDELKRSLGELTDAYEFHVIFYSSGPPVEMPTRRLVNATERNKDLAYGFVDSIIPHGETDPSAALERAFACRPEVIYLLTDGEFDSQVVDLVRRLNVGKKTVVHTICFMYRSGERVLRQIANENGGTYRFVAEADLANLAR